MAEEKRKLRHVVLIPDGNGRWATEKGLAVEEGHKKGFEAVEAFLSVAKKRGVEVVTLWGFSTENWNRPDEEVSNIKNIVAAALNRFGSDEEESTEQTRFVHLGDKEMIKEKFPDLHQGIVSLEESTRDSKGTTLCLAFNYGGRDEVLRAIKKLMKSGKNPDEITYNDFENCLDTAGLPDPDLIIRTSGEQRLSGILPMQSVYAELIFENCYLPDFSKDKIEAAFDSYYDRDRRFGARKV